MIESPPRRKKSSSSPTRSTPSTCANTSASNRSTGVDGARNRRSSAPNTGSGNAARSTFPDHRHRPRRPAPPPAPAPCTPAPRRHPRPHRLRLHHRPGRRHHIPHQHRCPDRPSRTTTTADPTDGCAPNTASISPSSIRTPRILTWKSARPTYSSRPRRRPPHQIPGPIHPLPRHRRTDSPRTAPPSTPPDRDTPAPPAPRPHTTPRHPHRHRRQPPHPAPPPPCPAPDPPTTPDHRDQHRGCRTATVVSVGPYTLCIARPAHTPPPPTPAPPRPRTAPPHRPNAATGTSTAPSASERRLNSACAISSAISAPPRTCAGATTTVARRPRRPHRAAARAPPHRNSARPHATSAPPDRPRNAEPTRPRNYPAPVRDHHALGPPGGAGRVDHIRQLHRQHRRCVPRQRTAAPSALGRVSSSPNHGDLRQRLGRRLPVRREPEPRHRNDQQYSRSDNPDLPPDTPRLATAHRSTVRLPPNVAPRPPPSSPAHTPYRVNTRARWFTLSATSR